MHRLMPNGSNIWGKKKCGNREGTGEIKERKLRHKHLKNFDIMGGIKVE